MTIEQVTCSSFSRSREWTDKFCFMGGYTATARAQLPANAYISFGISHEFGGMSTTTVQRGTDTATFGRTGKKNWFECWTLWVLPVSFYPPFTHSFLHLTHLVYVCIFSKHHSAYVKCKPPFLEKLTCFYFTPHWLRLLTSGTERKHTFQILWILFCFIGTGTLEKTIAWNCKYNFYCFKNCYAAVKDHLLYQHPQQITTLSIYTLLLSPWFLSTYISMLNTDLADGKAFQDTFLVGPKAHAISTKVHYNSQHPLKPKANPTSNFSRGLQMVEHKPEPVLGQARSETKKC